VQNFYSQVGAETENGRFFAECAVCGKRHYDGKLPLICRSKGFLVAFESKTAGRFRSFVFSRAKESAVRRLSIFFNRCTCCGKWVCDSCCDLSEGSGKCVFCAAEKNKTDREE
jgi:hypothetical protein